jgi:arylsulfatase A-like enzyme
VGACDTRALRALLAAAVGLAACQGGDRDGAQLRVVRRFVDGGSALTAELPVATILDDTRFALAAPRERVVVWPKFLPDHEGARIMKLRPVLPKELHGAERILVLAHARIDQDWTSRPPEVVAPIGSGAVRTVRVDVPLPAVPAGTPVMLTVSALALDPQSLAEQRTGALEIPPAARLEFSLGLLHSSWGYDPVEFAVDACAEERCETIFAEGFDPADGEAWRDRSLELPRFAGEVRHFRFRTRRLAREAPFSIPVWGNPTLYASSPRPPDARNVILLSVDTLRADHLGTYGYARDTSPFIDDHFGRGGAVFESPVASATITTPSHASIFTSLQPTAHGTTDGMRVIPKHVPTLPEWARAAGIDTAGITEDGWLGIRHGFGRGFDVYRENKSASIMSPDGQVDRTFAEAASWLERNRSKRFFLFLHTFQVHSPYAPPPRYAGLFADPQGREAAEGERSAGPRENSPSHERWRDDYDREIRYTDDELRKLVQRIEALGLASSTVFILTADHGEAFLEHGLIEHGGRLHEEVVRVPMLFAGPGIPAGRRIAAPVSHVDLLPTVLELLGLPAPKWAQGRSLLGVLSGREPETLLSGRALFSETRTKEALAAERRMIPFPVPAFMVRQGSRKLLRYPDPAGGHRYELYDLASDPGELRDLHPTEGATAEDLRALLDGYEAGSRAHRERVDALLGASGAPAEESAPLDPAQEEKLRALGYLE